MGADIQYKCVVSVILFCVIIIIIENTNYRGLAFVVTGQTDTQTLFGVESWSTLTLFRPTRIVYRALRLSLEPAILSL